MAFALVAVVVLAANGSLFEKLAGWAAFVGVAAGLAGLFLYRGLREALNASREANATLKEAVEAEKLARESAERRHDDELRETNERHTHEIEQCHRQIAGLTAKVELLQSTWVTEISVEVAHAVATAHKTPPRRGGGS